MICLMSHRLGQARCLPYFGGTILPSLTAPERRVSDPATLQKWKIVNREIRQTRECGFSDLSAPRGLPTAPKESNENSRGYPVLEVTATVEPFENWRGFTLRVLRAGKPRSSTEAEGV
jgi:hypothetical protein